MTVCDDLANWMARDMIRKTGMNIKSSTEWGDDYEKEGDGGDAVKQSDGCFSFSDAHK